MSKLIIIVFVFFIILVLSENLRMKILPTKNEKRKKQKIKYGNSNGDYDETLKINTELTQNDDFTHGTARLLTEREKNKLVENDILRTWKIGTAIPKNTAGIVLGELDDGSLLYNGGDDHAIIVAATGGGKTTTFVKATLYLLLHSGENIILFDPKIELLRESRKLAEQLGYSVFSLNLNNKFCGNRMNPFWGAFENYTNDNLKDYLKSLDEVAWLESLFSEIDKGSVDSAPIWENSEKGVYGIGILLMFELVKRRFQILENFKDVSIDELQSKKEIIFENMVIKKNDKCEPTIKMLIEGKNYDEIMHDIKMSINFISLFNVIRYLSTRVVKKGEKIPNIKEIIENDQIFSDFEHIIFIKSEILLDSAEETYQSMLATPKTKLSKLANVLVSDLLSGYPGLDGYIDLPTLCRTDKNITYISVREDDRSFGYIAQMFITQYYSALKSEADKQENGKLKTKTHFLGEEFGNLPKIEGLTGMLTLSRGIGVRFYLVIQSVSQLREIYGENNEEIIKANAMLIVLPINDLATAKEVSEILGNATIEDIIVDEELSSNTSSVLDGKKYNITTRTQNIARNIKTPDELLIIKMGEAYVKKQQLRPMFNKMPISFKNKDLLKLELGSTPLVERNIEKHTLVPKDIDFLLKRINVQDYLEKLEREEKMYISINIVSEGSNEPSAVGDSLCVV